MYLKSLEILGFKSFAPKTVLNFHEGVTCIVGPNGCGKSNVLDAMRWVLGEQSAKALRGGEMSDVIFSGTDSRQPLGMAEVSMNFAECEKELGLDWNEVTITRRVFRDGGSEYLLNKTPCRLKDIQQLFMGTGIGRSAYSIMEQGKIDSILSTKPEDRRSIFEEAAGITKFKVQKKEAMRKLEATEANLVRLQDIIKEVKRQIGSLQRQAGKARRYQALIQDLKVLETHSAKRQWDILDEQRQRTAEELQALAVRQQECESEIERQEAETSAQRAALEEMEQQLDAARRVVNDLKTRISNHENRIIFNNERADEFTRLVDRYRADVAGAEEKLRIAETQLHQTDIEMEQITTMLAGELRRMEEQQAATASLTQQRREAEQEINNVAGEAQRIENKLSSLRGQISSVAQQRDGAEARLSILSSELEQITATLIRINEQQTSAQAELERAQNALEMANAQSAEAEGQLREAQSALGQLDNELRGQQRILSDKESKLEVLKQMVAGGEGFSAGTQAILRGLDNPDLYKPAVLGALAQFIEVQPEYVPSVEAVLASNLQTIVMKDTSIAEAMMNTLAEKKLGKASLALREFDSVFTHVESEALSLPEGAIDWLINKVTYAPEVSQVVERLVNHTLLVPDLETAIRIFPQRGSAIVTLRGEVLSGNAVLHGGKTAEAADSLLERKNEIHALEAELAGVHDQVTQLSQRRDVILAEIEAAQARLEEARENRQNATVILSTSRTQLSNLEREQRETERKSQNIDGERGSIEARYNEAAERLNVLEGEVQSALQQLEALQGRRAEASSQLEVLRAQEAEVASELNELKIKVATERQRHSSLHNQRAPMEARLAELSELISQRERDINDYEQRAAATVAENAEIEGNLEGLRVRVGESEAEVSALLEQRAGIAASVEQMNNDLRIHRNQLSHCHDQRSRLEVKQNQLDMRAAALSEHIQKRYQIDLREFQRDLYTLRVAIREAIKRQRGGGSTESEGNEMPRAEEPTQGDAEDNAPEQGEVFDIDWARVELLVRELDQRLDGMGPVNLDAIQEYDELEERHSFLEKQNNDLLASKDELLAVIAKINTTTRQLFAETFEKIRVNFQEMFGELFGGGKANLLLTDESDPLESGIDIIAKPPGKQLQSISLLSGGERTMTAVSLLFAIYMVKPSPFCVLDEMDAPLDESNISRFIKILDRFVGQSQFIVISHHKRTIARADALYGVTMEEHGVSKLVGVRFAKRDESHTQSDIIGTANPDAVPSVAETFGKSGNLRSEAANAG
ncbi:chromosome segregation protein SMC [Verrucomicrobiota bacterium sgz303538]